MVREGQTPTVGGDLRSRGSDERRRPMSNAVNKSDKSSRSSSIYRRPRTSSKWMCRVVFVLRFSFGDSNTRPPSTIVWSNFSIVHFHGTLF